ncbi:hypothetical protein [Ktedonobacter sp. SOSP1-85]|uniref:hypothetical protein n=1 Tax=Ktedonobacter sp. SOSP1-85 TaxID=2778367 RepID=UPI001915145F|nr:hypothetical protein [Ktedonobacter sp. SOSP1-85]
MLSEQWHFLARITCICFIAWLSLVVVYHKFDSTWWGISIWWFAIFLTLVAVGIMVHYKQFNPQVRTSKVMQNSLVFYLIFSLVAGVLMTESTFGQAQSSYSYSHTRTGMIFSTYTGNRNSQEAESAHITESGSGESSHTGSSSGKGAGYLFLILLILVALFASAIVPHFWVIAGFMTIVLLLLLTIKEFRRASLRAGVLEARRLRKQRKKEKSREERKRKRTTYA